MFDDEKKDTSELEAEFTESFNLHKKDLDFLLAQAQSYMKQAVELSEKYGIPFHGMGNEDYVPHSLAKGKFSELDMEVVNSIMNDSFYYHYDYRIGGWVNSSDSC